jgi:bacterioferritin
MSIEYIQGIQKKLDINETIKQLRKALADELNAIHNYWVQSKVIQGAYKEDINKELMQHYEEEQKHANMLAERILQLGGNPEIRPLDWERMANCDYIVATTWDQKAILNDALQGEKCAADHYSNLANFLRTRDDTTYDIVSKILDDEFEHIRDLNKLKTMVEENLYKKGEENGRIV